MKMPSEEQTISNAEFIILASVILGVVWFAMA